MSVGPAGPINRRLNNRAGAQETNVVARRRVLHARNELRCIASPYLRNCRIPSRTALRLRDASVTDRHAIVSSGGELASCLSLASAARNTCLAAAKRQFLQRFLVWEIDVVDVLVTDCDIRVERTPRKKITVFWINPRLESRKK